MLNLVSDLAQVREVRCPASCKILAVKIFLREFNFDMKLTSYKPPNTVVCCKHNVVRLLI